MGSAVQQGVPGVCRQGGEVPRLACEDARWIERGRADHGEDGVVLRIDHGDAAREVAEALVGGRAGHQQVGRTGRDVLRGRSDAASRELAVDTMLAGADFERVDSDEFEQLPDAHPLVVVLGYGPVLITMGPAAVAGKAIIWLTVFVMSPFVSLLWRIRRKLADATAVQLTRQPDALADGLRKLAGMNVKVPGAAAVHWLFPVWDPEVDRDQTRSEVTTVLLHMHLPLEPRLRRLERLGASPGAKALKKRDPGLTWGEVAGGAGWIGVGAVILGGVVALTAVGAMAVLYFLGWLLDRVLVVFPGWVAGLFG